MAATPQRHALITGGGSGIGAAIAVALAEAGCRVSICGRRRLPLQDVTRALQGNAGAFVEMDVTDEASIASGVAHIVTEQGPIDVLVNNAGQAASMPLANMERFHWDDMLSVNLTSVYLVTKAVLPGLTAKKSGRIINIASTAGLTGYAYVSAYVAAKHGVVGLTRALALELAKSGITVNAICPGYTRTPLIDGAVANISAKTGMSKDEAKSTLAGANPMGRLIEPDEVAAAVLWLASDAARSVTGQAISISGGEVLSG